MYIFIGWFKGCQGSHGDLAAIGSMGVRLSGTGPSAKTNKDLAHRPATPKWG